MYFMIAEEGGGGEGDQTLLLRMIEEEQKAGGENVQAGKGCLYIMNKIFIIIVYRPWKLPIKE